MRKKSIDKKINKNLNGFSMMEVVIAVFLISTGLIAAVQLISSGVATSMDSRDQVVATELSQEGLELVRNIRDNNWANSVLSFDHIFTNNACRIDSSYTYPADMVCDNNSRLFLNANNLYTHNSAGATATKFYRNIKIEAPSPDNRIITSMVSWNGSIPAECTLINKCVYAQVKLTTWGE